MAIEQGNVTTEIQAVLAGFNPISNTTFYFEKRSGGVIISKLKTSTYTDEDILNYIIDVYNQADYFHSLDTEGKSILMAEARAVLENEKIGGLGVTHRTLDEIEKVLPGVTKRLSEAHRKIVILGNGLSTAVEDILTLHDQYEEKPTITLLDLVDPRELLADLIDLKDRFAIHGLPFPTEYEQDLERCAVLLAHIQAENIQFVPYFMGDNMPPQEAQCADFILNIHGPNEYTVDEQISLLNTGGVYMTNYLFIHRKDPSFVVEPYIACEERKGTIITKL